MDTAKPITGPMIIEYFSPGPTTALTMSAKETVESQIFSTEDTHEDCTSPIASVARSVAVQPSATRPSCSS